MSIQQVAALHEVGLLQVIPVARGGRLGSAVHTAKYSFKFFLPIQKPINNVLNNVNILVCYKIDYQNALT